MTSLNSSWTTEHLYYNNENYFRDLFNEIKKAQKSICLESYIFANGKILSKLFEELASAAHRGVEVFLIADGIGSYDLYQGLSQNIQKNISIRIYNPPVGPGKWLSQHLKRRWVGILGFFFRLNRRTHKKICVIDSQIAFVGSFNIMDSDWHETGVRLEGEPVKDIEKSFYWTWYRAVPFFSKKKFWRFPLLTRAQSWHPLVRVNHTRRWRKSMLEDYFTRLVSAKEKVYLVTPYFNPPRVLIRSLEFLCEKKVKVKLLLPLQSDVAVFSIINQIYFYRLIRAGAEIYLYKPKILHSKISVIDGWATVGSTNLNSRSFFHDQELDVVLANTNTVHELVRNIEKDFQLSQKINVEQVKHSWLVKVSLFFLKPFLRWM